MFCAMFIPDKLKLNKFKLVHIPSNKEYFGRVGLQSAGTSAQYTGDDFACPVQSKIDEIAEADAEFSRYLKRDDS